MIKLFIAEEGTPDLGHKVYWIRNQFDKTQYKITTTGFLINDYWVEFTDEKLALLYRIQFPS